MGEIRLVDVTDQPLDRVAIERLVADDRAGAVVTFSGNVREHDHGRAVSSLTYEGHPTAQAILAEVAKEIDSRFEIVALAVAHRVGALAIGDAALVAVVASAHRGEAFAACQALVDLTKERLPVWKHQVFADGTDEWVNCA
jgi:molybdopterin synthase catalytic subunit